MANVTRSSTADIEATSALRASQLPGSALRAGEDLDPAAPCYIKTADGLVYMCVGDAKATAVVAGFTAQAVPSGDPVTLYGIGSIFTYDSAGGLTKGQRLYVSATAGRLDAAATTGDTEGVALALTTQLIVVTRLGGIA